MVPSVQATLGESGWLGSSRTSTTLPGAAQSQLPLSLGLSQGGKNSPCSQRVLAQTDAWRCQEFGFCVPWAWSVTFPGVTRQVAAVVTAPLLPGMLEFQGLTPAVPGRASPARCLPQTLLLALCASCLVNNSCQERQRQWNLFKTRRL